MSLDLIEEKNLSEAALKERFLAMEQLMTILYCREVFRDFRKPVEVMYPHLAATYHSVIKRPMDLGTLLLKTMKREVLTVHELRTNLQLVHNNAMYFNEGAPLMEAVSKHLEHFAGGLFEEIMRFPYHVSGGGGAKGSGKPDTSHNVRLEKRRLRLVHIRDQTLEYSEVRRLLGILSNPGGIPVPEVLHPALAQARAALAKRLSLDVSPEDSQLTGPEVTDVSTLRAALQPILEAATLPPMAGNTPALGAVLVHCMLPAAQGRTRLRTECLAYVGQLEEQIGILAVLVEERLLRGSPYSCVWAVPAEKFVYAQSISMNPSADGKNRSPWWPCMVIAAGDGSGKAALNPASLCSVAPPVLADNAVAEDSSSIASAPHPPAGVVVRMAPEVVRANLARFPAEIVKQLNKLKPRTATAHAPAPALAAADGAVGVTTQGADPTLTAASAPAGEGSSSAPQGVLAVPEGYLLLEYFGAHDFGWVKADAVYSMYSYSTAPDGTVEVVKGAAPGKQSYKDSVVEAEEAWRALHRRRRRAGLVQCPSKARRGSVTAIGAGSAEGSTEDDDVNFLLGNGSSGATGDGSAALSPESDDDADTPSDEDLIAPPSMEDLEESVEVPVAIVGATVPDVAVGVGGASSGAVGGAAVPTAGKASGSKGGGGKRKAPTPSLLNADGLFDSLTNLGASPSGQGHSSHSARKSSHGSANRGAHYSAADDRRLYLASPEEILRYRAGVEYILPENLRVENLRRCCEDGRFKTSLCPLPLPTMQDMASPRNKPGEVKRESSLGDSDVIAVDAKVRVTFRPKALMRTRALSFYLNAVRPLHFEHYMPTPSKKGFPAIPPSLASQHSAATAQAVSLAAAAAGAPSSAAGLGATVPPSASQASLARTGDDVQSTGDSDLAGLLIVGEDTAATAKGRKSGGEAGVGKGEKRKYLPKQKGGEDGLLPDGTHAPITAANIHIPANLSLSASCFILDAGCTRYAAGEGSVYTRTVDLDAKLFHLESRSRAARKRILRQELASLQAAIEQLQQVSQQRQLRENERKLRFQQLQQQQLQQQLQQQQQYALAAPQQQQQYLMKLIDQQQQQLQEQQSPRQTQPALPSVALPPKKAPSKPKAPKLVAGELLLSDGVEVAAPAPAPASKPRPKPQTTITYNAPLNIVDGSPRQLGEGGLVSADALRVTLPPKPPSKKKPRAAPVVGPDGQVIEGSAPAPKRAKVQKASAPRLEEALSALPGSPAAQPVVAAATPDLSVLASAAASILEAAGIGGASPRF